MPQPADPAPIAWQDLPGLDEALTRLPAPGLDEQRAIIDTAASVLADHYAHLPQKLANHGIDAPRRIRALHSLLPHLASPLSFHAELADAFADLRDLHTHYELPAAFADQVASLPFLVARIANGGQERIIVTRVIAQAVPDGFEPGVELLSWSGVAIGRALERLALRSGGANPAAGRARALNALTRRALIKQAAPDEAWVEVGYRALAGDQRVARLAWRVGAPPDAAFATHDAAHDLSQERAGEVLRRHGDAQFPAPAHTLASALSDCHPLKTPVPCDLPQVSAWRGCIDGRAFGHVRLHSFAMQQAEPFLDGMSALLQSLPQDGLILDVRDNPGGLVPAAERLLQLLTGKTVTPMAMQFLATEANLALCERHTPGSPDHAPGFPDLSRWVAGLADALAHGRPWGDGPAMTQMTPPDPTIYAYPGRIVLLTSALCYSACDFFIAGFRDNDLGSILGVDDCTGAGGANVQSYANIMALRGDPAALPLGVGLRLSLRRAIRSGPQAGDVRGLPLEENGVTPDEVHTPTLADALCDDIDLIGRAMSLLRAA